MFDTDRHLSIPEALDLAERNGVAIALSNLCLELWFLLHFQEQRAWIHRHSAQAMVRGHLSDGKR